jgi:hypothetical protein
MRAFSIFTYINSKIHKFFIKLILLLNAKNKTKEEYICVEV